MTCIVAITDGKKVYMAGDTAGVGGFSISRRKDPKVGKIGKFIFGFCGSFRVGQIMLHDFKPPKIKGKDLYSYMVSDFTKALRKCLKGEGAYFQVQGEDFIRANIIVGIKGRLFTIESDFQVGELQQDFAASGCGEDIALGSLFTTGHYEDLTTEERLTLALDAACEFSSGVRGPYNYVTT